MLPPGSGKGGFETAHSPFPQNAAARLAKSQFPIKNAAASRKRREDGGVGNLWHQARF
jgi:hypothetical protein